MFRGSPESHVPVEQSNLVTQAPGRDRVDREIHVSLMSQRAIWYPLWNIKDEILNPEGERKGEEKEGEEEKQ